MVKKKKKKHNDDSEVKLTTKKQKKKSKKSHSKHKNKSETKQKKKQKVQEPVPQKVTQMEVYATLQHIATLVAEFDNKPVIYDGARIYKAEINTLKAISELEPVRTIELANSLKVTRNAVLKNANKLLRKGLIEKQKNVENQRVIEFKLSKNGEKFLNQYNSSLLKLHQPVLEALKHMSSTELAYFNDGLQKILINMLK